MMDPGGMRASTWTALVALLALVACGGTKVTTTPPAAATPPATAAAKAADASAPAPPADLGYDEAITAARGHEGPGTPLTDTQLQKPMHDVAFIAACGAPSEMKLTVRIAVHAGRAYAATVTCNPRDSAVSQCVARAVRALEWPATDHRDFFTVTY